MGMGSRCPEKGLGPSTGILMTPEIIVGDDASLVRVFAARELARCRDNRAFSAATHQQALLQKSCKYCRRPGATPHVIGAFQRAGSAMFSSQCKLLVEEWLFGQIEESALTREYMRMKGEAYQTQPTLRAAPLRAEQRAAVVGYQARR